MMFSQPESANMVDKYFPNMGLLPGSDLPQSSTPLQDLLLAPLSISTFSSALTSRKSPPRNRLRPLRSIRSSAALADAAVAASSDSTCSTSGGSGEEAPVLSGGRGRKTSWGDMPKFLLAGAVSTIVSRTFVAPLERIKLECITHGSNQAWTRTIQVIWVKEGLRGFWKGNALNLFRMIPFRCVNFICYDMYCDFLLSLPGKMWLTSRDRLLGGGVAGITATCLCLPLDTIRTRLIAPGGEALGGVRGCFLHMLRKEGFFSLYRGLTPAVLSMGPANAVFYAMYDMLKTSHLSRKRRIDSNNGGGHELGAIWTLIYGAIAGACAETVTYPLEVIRRQLQLQQCGQLGLISAFGKSIERNGVGSLFAGIVPSTLQVLPSASLSYLFYELMKSLLKIN